MNRVGRNVNRNLAQLSHRKVLCSIAFLNQPAIHDAIMPRVLHFAPRVGALFFRAKVGDFCAVPLRPHPANAVVFLRSCVQKVDHLRNKKRDFCAAPGAEGI
jgi:hypothetical protein